MKYVIASLLLISALGCKQGDGERCQTSSDCKSPLICNRATLTCQNMQGSGIDVILPIDAPPDSPTDATPTDAPHD